jgi:2-methylcitrate dehydratase PrpD
MEKDIGKKLVEFAVKTKYEDIPEEALEFTKRLALKTVSGMLAGSDKPSGRKIAGIIKNQNHPEDCVVVGSGFKTSLWEASFLNAYYAHASELEDDRIYAGDGPSWDITVIPMLFPFAERLMLSGRALMEAMAVGLEVHIRTCLSNSEHIKQVLIPGAVGPAVAAAKAMGLGFEETAGAFGLALSGVPLSYINLRTDAHFFESALHSLQGIMAAEMAQVGLFGNPDIDQYLSNLIGKEKVARERMLEGLGERWMLREIMIKKYPVCTHQHRQIDLVIELMKKYNLSHKEIKVVEVHGSPADILCDNPDPKDENELNFSFQHNLAVATLDGDVGLERINKEAVNDPKLKEARAKVKFILHPELSNIVAKEPGRIVIKTKDGREFSGERMYPIGHPEEPLTLEKYKELYIKFTRGKLAEKDILVSGDLILNLETLDNIKQLSNILLCA